MALIVQHNLTAMNANRQLGITTGAQAKSTEKLSSGYRINRAGDDAAGLTISEKMRSQIRGLEQASTNAQDGVSLIQSAEGALNEAHSILQRMNELAVQGANDTNEAIDRDAINKELEALTTELDRISTTTQFNKQNLLDGTFQNKNLQVGANANQNISITIGNMNAETLGLRDISATAKLTQTGQAPSTITYNGLEYKYDLTKKQSANVAAAVSQFNASLSAMASENQYAVQYASTGSVYYVAGSTTAVGASTTKYATASAALKADVSLAKATMASALKNDLDTYVNLENTTGATATVAPGATTTIPLARVNNYTEANATITAVQNAINKVSTQRSALGALQNRLEHTIANLDVVAENTTAAESRIRDVDMAEEMVEYSKNNILAQAGQSMLAQANQSTRGVLSLLG